MERMPLSIIGSGFGRTGTMSLKLALERLGFGPCHHMDEVMSHPDQLTAWCSAARGEPVDWEAVLAGYRSTVDWPAAHYWRQLAESYPAARIIHTTRSPESWWESYSTTIARVLASAADGEQGGTMTTIPEMAHAIIAEQTFGSACDDREAAIAAFKKRDADVVAAIPSERLLVFRPGDGWQPLCEFLGVAVQEGPFPHANDRAGFWSRFGDLADGQAG
jgi:hypothetical protein